MSKAPKPVKYASVSGPEGQAELVADGLPTSEEIRRVMRALGSRGGSVKSEVKAAAARANGAKRKTPTN